MTFENIVSQIGSVPHMPPERGRIIYDFIRSEKPENVLELGFAHGTSSCYIAAAMQENGFGKVLTLDHTTARDRQPNILQLLQQTQLSQYVEPRFCARSYTWELLGLIEKQTNNGVTTPCFDFVFIDGGHTWDSDGFGFLLADKLLKSGGWMLFDDMLWMPKDSVNDRWLESMPEEERNVAHVEKVFNLLVVPHGNYGDFEFDGMWAWARKKNVGSAVELPPSVLSNIYKTSASARRGMQLRRYVKKILGK